MEKTCIYETLFVVSGALAEDEAKAAAEKFTTLIAENGKIIKIDEWGKRRLAYPINKVNEGYYVLVTFTGAPEFPEELERLFGINDAILRSMTTVAVAKKAAAAVEPKTEAPADAAAE